MRSPFDPAEACEKIHSLLAHLPILRSISDVKARCHFADGLYFFYELGEESVHAPEGRIVRVGNHPRAAGGLVRRLQNHYRSY